MKYFETTFTITAPHPILPDARDLLAALAGEAGYETFEETPTGLKGYVQASLYDAEALALALQEFPFEGVAIGYDTHEAENRDWNEAWELEGFSPIVIGDGRCAIHDGRHLPSTKAEMEVEIDARLAFGTGNHETTRMVANRLLALAPKGKRLLDAGCGTGILGIVGLKAGAAHATGYDIDEWSVDNARHNAAINGVADRYEALLGDASVIERRKGEYDIVVANIFREILIADMGRLAQALAPGGSLIVSGFLEADTAALQEAAARHGLAPSAMATEGGWACLTLDLPSPRPACAKGNATT